MSFGGWGPQSGERVGAPCDSYENRQNRGSKSRHWHWYSASIRFYGGVLLIATKTADALTTAIGVRYVPGIVEVNPLAKAVFASYGTVTGLTVLSFGTVLYAMLVAELLSIELRRQRRHRLGLLAQASVYVILAVLFGVIAVKNGLLISELVTTYLTNALTPG